MVKVPALRLELPNLDGEPKRALSCVNVRHEEKALIDVVWSWWAARSGVALKQPDAMSRILQLALEHPEADLPPGLLALRRAKK